MDQLATVFTSLRHENGEPDDQARRSALDSLLQHLTLQEIRRTRIQLGSYPVCDICDFPLELIIRIFVNLSLEDVLSLRLVSRKWSNILSSTDFCWGMTEEHFRPHWVRINKDAGLDSGLKRKDAISKWFQDAAISRIRRTHGYYHSMSIYWHHMSPGEAGLEPHCCAEFQYSNGRLGLKFDRSTIRVKSLRSDSEDRIYMYENREPFENWLLSDNYLICLKASPTTLLAWSLDSTDEEQPHRVRLPSKVLNLSASQNRVAIVTTGYEVFIWTVGGSLNPLNISIAQNSLQFTKRHLTVLWDPAEYNNLYVVYEGVSQDGKLVFVILQFPQRLQQAHWIGFAGYSSLGRRSPRVVMLQAGVIGILHLGRLNRLDRTGKELRIHSNDRKDLDLLTFNTYTGCFNIYYYPIPDSIGKAAKNNWPHVVCQLHFWRYQILIPTCGQQNHEGLHNNPAGEAADGALLASLSAFSGEHKGPIEVPLYSQQESGKDKKFMLSDNSSDPSSSINYFWGAGAKFADAQKPPGGGTVMNSSRRVMGDDDFVVLCGNYGFVVWCFDRKVKLPTASRWSEADVPLWRQPGAPASARAFHPLA